MMQPTPTKPKRLSIAAHSVESNHSDNGLSESDLSSVIDDKPAPRKRRKNTQSGKEKGAREVCWWELKKGKPKKTKINVGVKDMGYY